MLGFQRYRYIVMVTIGDNKHQGFNMATKFFMDKTCDGFVSESCKVDGSFIIAIVYGVYCMWEYPFWPMLGGSDFGQ